MIRDQVWSGSLTINFFEDKALESTVEAKHVKSPEHWFYTTEGKQTDVTEEMRVAKYLEVQ